MSVAIGIGLPNQVRDINPRLIAPWAVTAERAGFAALGSVGRIAYPGVMDTVALAAASGATERIELISGVALGTAWPAVLFAKEAAGIDGVSGGRLTLGLGIGIRPDDFTVGGLGFRGLGARMDDALQTYRSVWRGDLVGGVNAAVPAGTREVPLMFGGMAPAAFARMARWGIGYMAPSAQPEQAEDVFGKARAAWRQEGREGDPRLTVLSYFVLADEDEGRRDVYEYYEILGKDVAAFMASQVLSGPDQIRRAVKACADLGADQIILNPTRGELSEVTRLAEALF